MADSQGDGSIAPRRSLGGPILPPPPPEMEQKAREAAERKAAADRAAAQRQAEKEARAAEREAKRNAAARQKADARKQAEARREQEAARAAEAKRAEEARKAEETRRAEQARQAQETERREAAERQRRRESARSAAPVAAAAGAAGASSGTTTTTMTPVGRPASPSSGGRPADAKGKGRAPRRTRRAQLRLVQVDAWSVMKTSFLLSIALGIVLVVAVAIIWSVLGAAGVWTSVNSIVQQAVGTDGGTKFDIQQYLGTSRVLGFTMILAVLDVILITAIATLGAFLYNLSAALLGGIEVTLAEDS